MTYRFGEISGTIDSANTNKINMNIELASGYMLQLLRLFFTPTYLTTLYVLKHQINSSSARCFFIDFFVQCLP
jgi:hypothetical protein